MGLHSGAVAFRFRGVKMVGISSRPAGPEGKKFPGVLFLHGFPGSEKNVDIQRELLKRGVASFAPHFQGAWGSDGYYRFSELIPQARFSLRYLRLRPFVDKRRLAVFGFSMGGWTAINMAALEPGLKAVAAVAPVGGPEMVRKETRQKLVHLGRTLRVEEPGKLYRDFTGAVREHDPAESAARLRCPLLLVHGSADEVVSPLVSERIFAAAAQPKTLVRARGATHDFLDRREWLTKLVCDWLTPRLKKDF